MFILLPFGLESCKVQCSIDSPKKIEREIKEAIKNMPEFKQKTIDYKEAMRLK